MDKTSLGDRIKNNYEDRYRLKLTRRTPVIIRLDGKAFHTLTKKCDKPYDKKFAASMDIAAMRLFENVQGCKAAYCQSDEISLLITDFDRLATSAWFDYNIQKMASIAASMASVCFTGTFGRIGLFDARAFNIPTSDVCNYFVWRQQDWTRNSIQMMAQAVFSVKQLHNKKIPDIHEMLHSRGLNWAKLNPRWKNGTFISKPIKTQKILCMVNDVIFTKDRTQIERLLIPTEE